jgi:hypothetical protein
VPACTPALVTWRTTSASCPTCSSHYSCSRPDAHARGTTARRSAHSCAASASTATACSSCSAPGTPAPPCRSARAASPYPRLHHRYRCQVRGRRRIHCSTADVLPRTRLQSILRCSRFVSDLLLPCRPDLLHGCLLHVLHAHLCRFLKPVCLAWLPVFLQLLLLRIVQSHALVFFI